MYRKVEWAVPADQYIMQELAAYEGWHTAKSLSLNTGFSRQWVSERCRILVDHDLLERHETDPAYRITTRGSTVANGDLSPLMGDE